MGYGMMATCAIVGVNWGDEGKGRMVDFLAEQYDVVVRYQGGNNAGHTVINEFGESKLNLIPSGIFRPETVNLLGAGTVIVTGRQEVKGLTTAAGLWASACMGLAIGAGFYECVVLAFVLIFLCIRLLPPLESMMVERARNMNLYVEFSSLDDVGAIIGRIKSQGAQIYEVDIERGTEESHHRPSAVFTIRLDHAVHHAQVMAAISELENVTTIDEI